MSYIMKEKIFCDVGVYVRAVDSKNLVFPARIGFYFLTYCTVKAAPKSPKFLDKLLYAEISSAQETKLGDLVWKHPIHTLHSPLKIRHQFAL